MAVENRLPLALCAYSLPHVMGYLPTQAGAPHPAPLSPLAFLDAARDLGLAGAELPLSALVPAFDGKLVKVEAQSDDFNLVEALRTRGLQVVGDYGALLDTSAAHLREYLQVAKGAGATVVRATLSHLLCGDRRKMAGGWDAHLNALAARLNEVLPFAEEMGVCIAVENHQDANSDDLLRLADMTGSSPAFGVTLDAGNPLAVGEDPVEFAARIAPLIRHVHLKDYTLHFAPEGYRLVRCAAGDGVVDFPAILAIVRANGHNVLPAIEVAAQSTRTIPLLETDWWDSYGASPATRLIPVLRLLWERGRPLGEPYASAWERGEDSGEVSDEEWYIVRRSVHYFRRLHAAANASPSPA